MGVFLRTSFYSSVESRVIRMTSDFESKVFVEIELLKILWPLWWPWSRTYDHENVNKVNELSKARKWAIAGSDMIKLIFFFFYGRPLPHWWPWPLMYGHKIYIMPSPDIRAIFLSNMNQILRTLWEEFTYTHTQTHTHKHTHTHNEWLR